MKFRELKGYHVLRSGIWIGDSFMCETKCSNAYSDVVIVVKKNDLGTGAYYQTSF